jgi:hypothetical protein
MHSIHVISAQNLVNKGFCFEKTRRLLLLIPLAIYCHTDCLFLVLLQYSSTTESDCTSFLFDLVFDYVGHSIQVYVCDYIEDIVPMSY